MYTFLCDCYIIYFPTGVTVGFVFNRERCYGDTRKQVVNFLLIIYRTGAYNLLERATDMYSEPSGRGSSFNSLSGVNTEKKIQCSPYCFNSSQSFADVEVKLPSAYCKQVLLGAVITIAWEICLFSESIRNGELKQVQNIELIIKPSIRIQWIWT